MKIKLTHINKSLIISRFLAFLVDCIFLYLLSYIANNFISFLNSYFGTIIFGLYFDLIFYLVIPGIYFGYFHSKLSQTPGMRIFNLILTNEKGENVNFLKSFLRTTYLTFSYILIFIILFIILIILNYSENSFKFINVIGYWFIFFNPIFLFNFIYIFLNEKNNTFYDKIFQTNVKFNRNINYERNSLIKEMQNPQIFYIQSLEKNYKYYLAIIIDIFCQILIILSLNQIFNNVLDPSNGYFISPSQNLFLNFLIFLIMTPIIYSYICLSKYQTFGIKNFNLKIDHDSIRKYILMNLIYTYSLLLIIEIIRYII